MYTLWKLCLRVSVCVFFNYVDVCHQNILVESLNVIFEVVNC